MTVLKSPNSNIRVMILGLRGLPNIQGGVETHVEKLAPRLQLLGCDVEVIARSPYQPIERSQWKGVQITRIWSPKLPSAEAIVHSLLGVIYAGIKRPDVLHIHAIGPAIVTPIARLFGLKVVVTHHGPDYDRQKWGRIGRLALRIGESAGMRFSQGRIVISPVIEALVETKYRKSSTLIPNGVDTPQQQEGTGHISRFGLSRQKYVLIVSRLVPEKRHKDLIEAFALAKLEGWKLAIVGGSDHKSIYEAEIKALAQRHPSVVLTGVQTGEALQQLFANAGLFVLPSSHEGLPIALLEAISYRLPVLASNIPPNLAVGLPSECYFQLGDVKSAGEMISSICLSLPDARLKAALIADALMPNFDWHSIALRTHDLYLNVLRPELGLGRTKAS
jgi:glycosyltransferase involved in cell wall biosynthesis